MKTIDEILCEWYSEKRTMGCVAAARWFCSRNKTFKPLRKRFYLPGGNDKNGNFWEHVVVSNGIIEIDISPYANKPREDS